jgi:hypothetical protein
MAILTYHNGTEAPPIANPSDGWQYDPAEQGAIDRSVAILRELLGIDAVPLTALTGAVDMATKPVDALYILAHGGRHNGTPVIAGMTAAQWVTMLRDIGVGGGTTERIQFLACHGESMWRTPAPQGIGPNLAQGLHLDVILPEGVLYLVRPGDVDGQPHRSAFVVDDGDEFNREALATVAEEVDVARSYVGQFSALLAQQEAQGKGATDPGTRHALEGAIYTFDTHFAVFRSTLGFACGNELVDTWMIWHPEGNASRAYLLAPNAVADNGLTILGEYLGAPFPAAIL